ncbi:MAG: hypothetical protein SGI94_09335 [Saprospiraceae bacterium]|nr:hypothetical protein [Saprospiraceae bacterium]
MNTKQIHDILLSGQFSGAKAPAHIVETHISWVILTPDYAFKIKKPVQFDFLDFSTFEKRRFYCGEELRLNRRLAPGMYLGVLPIGTVDGRPAIGAMAPPLLDYAVWMHRMDEQCQMDLLLAENQVTKTQMEELASQLAAFHRRSIIRAPNAYCPGDYLKDFEDLYHEEKDAVQWLGLEALEQFHLWKAQISAFLTTHATRMRTRFEKGFWVDGHGDLHTRNIFLLDEPVVFDCLEFNPHFRRLDVLSELAFLCMDLEARGHTDLALYFLNAYRQVWEITPEPEDELLFLFFKAYRANIRLKVSLLELRQHERADLLESVRGYWGLLKNYCNLLQTNALQNA